MLTSKQFDDLAKEIEQLQKDVDKIIYNKNWFVRVFGSHKAKRLHRLADKKLCALWDLLTRED